jgi:hypothetical protein
LTRSVAEGTRVALKVVHPHLLDTPERSKRFLREGEIGVVCNETLSIELAV